jgi:hypothetical protein
MTAFKNLLSIIVAIIAALVTFNAFTLVAQSSIHQIYVTCNYILATLMFIFSYLLADWTFADKSFIKEAA